MKFEITNLKYGIVPFVVASFVGAASSAHGQASFPMLMSVEPMAVQVGGTTPKEHLVQSRFNLAETYGVFVQGTGVTGTPVLPKPEKEGEPPAEKTKVLVKFAAAKDAQLGVREFRLGTPIGLSTIGQIVVVQDPIFVETKGNDTAAEATPMTIPGVACGAIEVAEDVDYFRFDAKEGETLTFQVRSARCEDKIHDLQAHSDPIVAVKNSAGVVLAANDNFFFADPALSYTFKQAGDYYLEVRDVRYQGNVYWQYCVEINDRPLPVTAVPPAVVAGKKTTIAPVGLNVAAGTTAEVDVPKDLAPGMHWLAPTAGKEKLAPLPLLVSDVPVTVESTKAHNAPTEAQDISLPTVVAGRLAAVGESDFYAFAAKKDEVFSFEVTARRAQSMLDSVIAIYDEKGKRLTEGDDQTWYRISSSDSNVETFTAKADGRYVVEIRDLHQRGGELFTYALSMKRGTPSFTLHADTDKVQIAGETGGCVFVRAMRKHGFTGEIRLAVEGLPKGLHAECGRILADGQDGVINFTADKGTKPTAAECRIVGHAVYKDAAGKETKLSAAAFPWQETYMPGGGRGHFPVDTFFVAVSRPMDVVKISVTPTEINLKPGTSQKFEIAVERGAGFEKSITLDLLFRHLARPYGDSLPKGVTIDEKQSKTIVSGKDLKGYITLKAAADAPPVEKQLVPVMAQCAINFVMKMSYCGEPLHVTVSK